MTDGYSVLMPDLIFYTRFSKTGQVKDKAVYNGDICCPVTDDGWLQQ